MGFIVAVAAWNNKWGDWSLLLLILGIWTTFRSYKEYEK